MAQPEYHLQGMQGGDVLTSASGAQTGKRYRWVQIVNDAVFSTVAAERLTNASALQTITHLAGTGFGGIITSLTVSSGVVIAYTE